MVKKQNLEMCLGYSIERQYKIDGYFLDGYCKPLKLAIEIDERYHNMRQKKDLLRQKNIEKSLGCNFLRIEVR